VLCCNPFAHQHISTSAHHNCQLSTVNFQLIRILSIFTDSQAKNAMERFVRLSSQHSMDRRYALARGTPRVNYVPTVGFYDIQNNPIVTIPFSDMQNAIKKNHSMMKKTVLILVILITSISCRSYLDCGKSIHSDYVDFNYMEHYNEFVYKSKINATADNEVYYTNHFSLNLPKKLKNWQSLSNEFYFEYEDKEIIYINAGFKNINDARTWLVRETSNDEIYTKLNSYWNKRGYNENALKTGQSGRISKVYSDEKVFILLYNIKKEYFDNYFDLVKSFKYLD
jgi:hypothetical protein